MTDLLRLGLNDLHLELAGKMVPFAGYDMPVQYPAGVMTEHLHTRAAAGLFDVSHMGQVILRPKADAKHLQLPVPKCSGKFAAMPPPKVIFYWQRPPPGWPVTFRHKPWVKLCNTGSR